MEIKKIEKWRRIQYDMSGLKETSKADGRTLKTLRNEEYPIWPTGLRGTSKADGQTLKTLRNEESPI